MRRAPSTFVDAHVLDFRVLLDALPGALAPEAGLLYAAERNRWSRHLHAVERDHPVIQSVRGVEQGAQVRAKAVVGGPDLCVVRRAEHFLQIVETRDRRHRPKRLFVKYAHRGRHIRQYGGRKEEWSGRMYGPACE